MPEPEPDEMTMQERRLVEFPYEGVIRNAVVPLLTTIVVPLQDEDAPVVLAPELGVPEPAMVIPMLLTVTPEVQVQLPEGMLTVSPSAAALMAACTALWLQEAALMVLCAKTLVCTHARKKRTEKMANASRFMMIGLQPGEVFGTFPPAPTDRERQKTARTLV